MGSVQAESGTRRDASSPGRPTRSTDSSATGQKK